MVAPQIELDHVVLEVTDPAAAAQFLSAVLGLAPVRLDEFGRGEVPFPSMRVTATTIIDLFPRRMWRGATAHNPNHLSFALTRAGFDAVRARLADRRIAETKVDEHNFGARGYGSSVYFDGPDALDLEIRYYGATP